jgi:RNA polymerase sigma factor (sigma-70 family)
MGVLFESAVGDDRAFERLYNSYAPNVFRYALAVLGQQADAEDVTQTTFMNAYRALRRGERPTKPENWLIAIARNACIERFRHDRRRPREVALERELPVAALQGDEATTATELQHALLQLPPTQRAALVMRELEGRSYAETAAALQISNSALETLLVRARRTLREQLEGEVSCGDAAAAIKMQLEGRLPLSGRRVLRAHLRSCDDCAKLARRMRAQKKSFRGLSTLWFPSWVGRFLAGGSGTAAGASATGGMGAAGLALKAAAMLAVGAAVGSSVYAGATHLGPLSVHRGPASVVHGASSRSEPLSALSNSSAAAQRPSATRLRGAVSEGAALASPVVVSATESAAAPNQTQETGLAASGSSANVGVVTGESTGGPSTVRAGSADTARTASGKGVVANGNGKGVVANGNGESRVTKHSAGLSSNIVSSTAGQANGGGGASAGKSSMPSSQNSSSSSSSVPPGQAKADANAGGGASSGTLQGPSAQNSSSSSPSMPPGQGNVNANANGNVAASGDTTGSSNANANPTAASAHGHG